MGEGSEAHVKFVEEYRKEKSAKFQKRREERQALVTRLLLDEYCDPYTDIRGRAILFHFDTGVDLYQTEGTVQFGYEKMRRMCPDKAEQFAKMEKIRKEATIEKIERLQKEGLTREEIVDKFKKDSEVVVTDREKYKADFELMKKQRAELQAKWKEEKELKRLAKLETKNPEKYKIEKAAYDERKAAEAKAKAAENGEEENKVEDQTQTTTTATTTAPTTPADDAKAKKEKARAEKKAEQEKIKAEKQKAKEEAKAL